LDSVLNQCKFSHPCVSINTSKSVLSVFIQFALHGFIFCTDNKRKSLDTISQMSVSPSGYGPSICSKGNEFHVISVVFRSLITRVVGSYKELKHPENAVSIIIL